MEMSQEGRSIIVVSSMFIQLSPPLINLHLQKPMLNLEQHPRISSPTISPMLVNET